MQMGKAHKTAIKENKAKIVKKYGKSETNSGTTEVQIALLTDRINTLTPHFQKHVKDHHSRLGLLKIVGQRRSLLTYLKTQDETKYNTLLSQLELRK